jgi:hypothetical protein
MVLPSGAAATTQSAGDNSTDLATDLFVQTLVSASTGINLASGSQTLSAAAASYPVLYFYGGSAPVTVTLPLALITRRWWVVENVNGYTTTLAGSSGGTLPLAPSEYTIVWSDGGGIYGLIPSGTTPIANGGTGAATASAALTALGAASSGANSSITSLTGLTTPLSVAQGGTGSNLAGAYSQSSVATPTAPGSTSAYTMQGLAGSIKPTRSGVVTITVSGRISVPTGSAAGTGMYYALYYGTGSAPSNGATLTGTVIGDAPGASIPAAISAAELIPFSVTGVVSGLTVGTTYWIDLAAKSLVTASAAAVQTVNVSATEQ